MGKSDKPSRRRIRQRSKELRRAISGMDYIASGTVHTRTKVCGRKNCRCAIDPDARHGPYHEWSRRQDGHLIHSILTEEQARLFAVAIANHHEVMKLLAQWQRETAAEILSDPKSSKSAKCRKPKS